MICIGCALEKPLEHDLCESCRTLAGELDRDLQNAALAHYDRVSGLTEAPFPLGHSPSGQGVNPGAGGQATILNEARCGYCDGRGCPGGCTCDCHEEPAPRPPKKTVRIPFETMDQLTEGGTRARPAKDIQ